MTKIICSLYLRSFHGSCDRILLVLKENSFFEVRNVCNDYAAESGNYRLGYVGGQNYVSFFLSKTSRDSKLININ